MLGYKPFFKEYTTDWDYAVAKMKGSFFQRHLVEESFASAKSWPEQARLEPSSKPTNAEYEQWTLQLDEAKPKLNGNTHMTNGIGDSPKGMANGVHDEMKSAKLSAVKG